LLHSDGKQNVNRQPVIFKVLRVVCNVLIRHVLQKVKAGTVRRKLAVADAF